MVRPLTTAGSAKMSRRVPFLAQAFLAQEDIGCEDTDGVNIGSLECTSLSGLASRTYAADMASHESHLSPPVSIFEELSQTNSTRG